MADVDVQLAKALDVALAEERWDAVDRISARIDARKVTPVNAVAPEPSPVVSLVGRRGTR